MINKKLLFSFFDGIILSSSISTGRLSVLQNPPFLWKHIKTCFEWDWVIYLRLVMSWRIWNPRFLSKESKNDSNLKDFLSRSFSRLSLYTIHASKEAVRRRPGQFWKYSKNRELPRSSFRIFRIDSTWLSLFSFSCCRFFNWVSFFHHGIQGTTSISCKVFSFSISRSSRFSLSAFIWDLRFSIR